MGNHKFLPYAQPYLFPEDIDEVAKSLTSSTITRGPKVEAFEKAMAEYCEAQYAVAFPNASNALTAAYHVADIGPSDRIITTPNSFIASVGPGIQCGATPIFIDIDRSTGNINFELLALNINQKASRGKTIVVPVHFAGIPVNMQALDRLIDNPNTIVIEDAAHAVGSCYGDGKKVGCCAWSDMTIFSFHPAKTMTTGEGGMVLTNNHEYYRRLQRFRNNGIEKNPEYLIGEAAPWYYEVTELTSNYNFTEMQAALGISQLRHLDTFVAKRQSLMRRYREKLSVLENIRLFTPHESLNVAYHLCVVQIDFKACNTSRTAIMNALKEKGIGTQLHYIPLYRHPFFTKMSDDISEYFPEMEAYYEQALSLPLFYDMNEKDVDRICESLNRHLAGNANYGQELRHERHLISPD